MAVSLGLLLVAAGAMPPRSWRSQLSLNGPTGVYPLYQGWLLVPVLLVFLLRLLEPAEPWERFPLVPPPGDHEVLDALVHSGRGYNRNGGCSSCLDKTFLNGTVCSSSRGYRTSAGGRYCRWLSVFLSCSRYCTDLYCWQGGGSCFAAS